MLTGPRIVVIEIMYELCMCGGCGGWYKEEVVIISYITLTRDPEMFEEEKWYRHLWM
jgi:hypothetical protein